MSPYLRVFLCWRNKVIILLKTCTKSKIVHGQLTEMNLLSIKMSKNHKTLRRCTTFFYFVKKADGRIKHQRKTCPGSQVKQKFPRLETATYLPSGERFTVLKVPVQQLAPLMPLETVLHNTQSQVKKTKILVITCQKYSNLLINHEAEKRIATKAFMF